MNIFKANEGIVTYTINKKFNNNLYISVPLKVFSLILQ